MVDRQVYQQALKQLHRYGTDPVKGLTSESVEANRRHGRNLLTPPQKEPLWRQYLSYFEDPTVIILCVCAAIAMGIGAYRGEMPWDGVAILIAVALATFGAFWSEYKADKAFELLKKDSDNVPVKVTRDGRFQTLLSDQLVVGDLIHVEGGDRIPGDATLLASVDLSVDESLMTGESREVRKAADNSRLIAGTYCTVGNGTAVVTAVGDDTKLGNLASALGEGFVCPDLRHAKIHKEAGSCRECGAELVEKREPETPLQQKLGVLAGQISVGGTYAAVFIFLALLGAAVFGGKMGDITPAWRSGLGFAICGSLVFAAVLLAARKRMLTNLAVWGSSVVIGGALILAVIVHGSAGNWLDSFQRVLDYFMIAVTIVVVAVPEGLPMAVTIALGFSMRKIRQDNNLVRKMLAAETIGSATVICCDKTGTLTENRMDVWELHFAGKHLVGPEVLSVDDSPAFELLVLSCALNSTAEIEHTDGQTRFVGNQTEGALLLWLERQQISYQAIRDRMPVESRASFTASRKMMSTETSRATCGQCESCPVETSSVYAQRNGCRIVLTKGAPERVLPRCTHVVGAGMEVQPISEGRQDASGIVTRMAENAARPLAIAYRICRRDEESGDDPARDVERGLTLLAIVGISDPVRQDVPAALHTCRQAGIEVKMITGDHAATAKAVARQIGLVGDDDLILTREEFDAKPDSELVALLPRLRVVSRAEPDDKKRLVALLREQDHVVAVTGDGVNDAPALKMADVGISMGKCGTEVAKQASDIVLTDDNFGSIVRAVHWGRTLYENLQRFLQFQLTVNLSALGVAFLSPILATFFPDRGFQPMPLTVLQYLWINLIMDTLAALAFALEPPRPETMSSGPKRRSEAFLTPTMLMNVVVLGVYFIALILLLQATDLLGVRQLGLGPLAAGSVVFNCYVWFQIFHLFNARSVLPGRSAFAGLSKSRSFFVIMGLVIVGQFMLVQFGGDILNTEALPLVVWIKIILLGSTAIVVGEAVRFVQKAFLAKEERAPAAPVG